MMINGKIVTTLVMLGLFSAACLFALQLPSKAAFMPLIVGVPGVLLCAAQLFLDIRFERAPKEDTESEAASEEAGDGARSETEMFVWLGVFTVMLLVLGFVAGGPLSVLLFVRYGSRDNWLNAAFAGVGTFVVLFGVFIWILGLTLFPGFLPELLFS